MERPSKELVDRAVEHYYEDSNCAIERSCAGILAAEVHALREELATANDTADMCTRQICARGRCG